MSKKIERFIQKELEKIENFSSLAQKIPSTETSTKLKNIKSDEHPLSKYC